MGSFAALFRGRRSRAAALRRARLVCLAAALALTALSFAAEGQGRLRTPVPTSPANGAVVESVPAFAWSAVPGAASYEFQIAADAGMNSPVLGRGKDQFITKNLRATLVKTVPNGSYYWRVRSITESGSTSPWSRPRSFSKRWSASATLQTPTNAEAVAFPLQPLKLSWSPVPGAAAYRVSIATDPTLGSLVGGKAVDTSATSYTRGGVLPSGVYYWGITPLDAQGNPGIPSSVSSFTWVWPSTTTPQVTDLASELEIFDPQFSWDRVPGAASYEVEVNSSQDFALGSKVCCSSPTIATSLSPTRLFKDNVYYWRVRAVDANGNAGVWNLGPSFNKAFDKVPPVDGTSIKNIHMRDNLADPGTDISTDPGFQTKVPVVTWDRVPGASSYQVEITPYVGADGAGGCNWSAVDSIRWQVVTAATAWTPLGTGLRANAPFGSPSNIARDNLTHLDAGERYCARVRAQSDRDNLNQAIFGDYTYLDSNLGWAFQWLGYPTGDVCSPSCAAGGYLGAGDYVLPQRGTVTGAMPLFTWRPLQGKQSYFVVVAKDAAFTNIVDYAFTQVPAYAPRGPSRPTTYPDETTTYYWVVLPATGFDGSGGTAGNPSQGAPADFQKRSTPPTLLAPASGSDVLDQPMFRWTVVDGARHYRFQVAQDPTFANPIDDVTTNSTAYTSETTYPADTTLYWRVRADDENLVGLTWSAPGTFRRRLAVPVLSPANPNAGDFIPTWTWEPTAGAVSYDVAVDLPDGTHRDLKGMPTAALTPTLMYGTGKFSWRVRANFPTTSTQVVPGPYSPTSIFTRTIGEPGGAHADVSKKHILLSWEPKAGVKGYWVQISERADFAQVVEQVKTDNTSYAPLLTRSAYQNAPVLYWRVAAFDEGNNVGDFAQGQRIARAKRLVLSASGRAARRQSVPVTITVVDKMKRPLRLVRVRVTGAGVRAVTRRTDARGKATFAVRATRAGTVTYRATKTGYEPGVLTQRVR
jgi:hypothetical protein